MQNQPNKNLTTNITKLVNQPYKYGFSTNIEKDRIRILNIHFFLEDNTI